MGPAVRPVRIGILGAARIAPAAVIRPAQRSPAAEVVAVAARDPGRAAEFAGRHGIPRVAPTYAALLEDAEVDAVYNPLPNGLHAEWTIKATVAGKHVLCEKPFTANAEEAELVSAAAERTGLVVMEAFHYRYHPLTRRAVEIVRSGELGPLRRVEAAFCFPLPRFSDIRYQLDLAGGATMDAGCYAIHMARALGGEEPTVVAAHAKLRSPEVDRAMSAQLRFPAGAVGRVTASMWSMSLLRISARVWGDDGDLALLNPLGPHLWHRLAVKTSSATRVEHFPHRPTFEYQLDAFCAAVRDGAPILTPPSDAIANMRVIDDVYRAAGLRPRPGTVVGRIDPG
jgi:predicted dehydrogenase